MSRSDPLFLSGSRLHCIRFNFFLFGLIVILLILPMFLILSCAPKPKLQSQERTPENVLRCTLHNELEFQTLACLMKLKMQGKETKFSGTIEFFYKSPDMFVLFPRTLFGIGGFKVKGDNDSLTIYFPKQNEFFCGSFPDLEKSELWNWKIPFRMVLGVILGQSGLSDNRLRYAEREGETLLYETEDEGWFIMHQLDARRCRLIESLWIQEDNEDTLKIEYRNFKTREQNEIPRKVVITSKSGDSITVEFLERRFDRLIPTDKFDLQIPHDALQIVFESQK